MTQNIELTEEQRFFLEAPYIFSSMINFIKESGMKIDSLVEIILWTKDSNAANWIKVKYPPDDSLVIVHNENNTINIDSCIKEGEYVKGPGVIDTNSFAIGYKKGSISNIFFLFLTYLILVNTGEDKEKAMEKIEKYVEKEIRRKINFHKEVTRDQLVQIARRSGLFREEENCWLQVQIKRVIENMEIKMIKF